jgi:hypothetical protein
MYAPYVRAKFAARAPKPQASRWGRDPAAGLADSAGPGSIRAVTDAVVLCAIWSVGAGRILRPVQARPRAARLLPARCTASAPATAASARR